MTKSIATQPSAKQHLNVDPSEVAKFDDLARTWWDKEGDFKPLHAINPLRLEFIKARTSIDGIRALDVGCGGGILSESLARGGAVVTGIDMAEKPLQVARLHRFESDLDIDYQLTSIEALSETLDEEQSGFFDVITCMEMLEHVPDPQSVINACRRLLKPGGELFLSTINRNPKAYALAVIGAEYILKLLPRGTHDYDKFIKPSELARWLREAGFNVQDMAGLSYNPLTEVYALTHDTSVNYLAHAKG
ncbi:MAG: 2-polyprenyl-6-hydroxyphenyl methylase/3-demethylubiquinone-9 3-methyltransferase [Candidatus Pseudothioglobus sp.]|jgi:2-polyprenyl-6-hydroxyphenyl methylase/3-demethylubiquinone-9 3-methyltransferase